MWHMFKTICMTWYMMPSSNQWQHDSVYTLLYIHSGKTGNFFSLVLCSLWWVQIAGYVLACRSYSFVSTLHHLIIIIVQTLYEDIVLIKCLSDKICRVCKYDWAYYLSYPLYNMWSCVFSVYPFPSWWLREYTYFVLLSSSNRKY